MTCRSQATEFEARCHDHPVLWMVVDGRALKIEDPICDERPFTTIPTRTVVAMIAHPTPNGNQHALYPC